MRLVDGTYAERVDNVSELVQAMTAGAAPMYPPGAWFENPELDKLTPITITADGRVFGHIADWSRDHMGLPPGTRPPRSQHDYAFFKTGALKTAEGDEVAVGNLTLSGGHAPLNASAAEAVEHYDDTASAVADVSVGEDQHGIWISGGLRPGVDETQIRALRASAPSGDWRPINGNLELVAICQVNTPGFPVARTMVASGEITSLVAAGASHMYELQLERSAFASLAELAGRVDDLETIVAAASKKDEEDEYEDENESSDEDAFDEDASDEDASEEYEDKDVSNDYSEDEDEDDKVSSKPKLPAKKKSLGK